MAEQTTVNLGDCKERVAYELMKDVLKNTGGVKKETAKEEILDTYAECLEAVLGNRTQ